MTNVGLGGLLIVMLSAVVEEFGGVAESVAITLKEVGEVVAVVGVPLMAPVLGFRVRPAGSVPVSLQVTFPAARERKASPSLS